LWCLLIGQNMLSARLWVNLVPLDLQTIYSKITAVETWRIVISIQKRESTRSSSKKWAKTLCRDYLHGIANFLTTPNVENKCWSSYETLECTVEMKLMIKFYPCFNNFTELWNLSSRFSVGNCLWCYFRQMFTSLAFRKCKKDCYMIKIILVQDFCSLKSKIARFPVWFRILIELT